LFISGPPAAGKGVQCEFLCQRFNIQHFSTGDMLRDEVSKKTELGLKAQEIMASGGLLPDLLIVEFVQNSLQNQDGWILDGCPRTVEQAQMLQDSGIIPDALIILQVPLDVIVTRAVRRRIDPETGKSYHLDFDVPPEEIAHRLIQRDDDKEEVINHRYGLFAHQASILTSFYQGKCLIIEVNGNQPKDAVFQDIINAMEANGFGNQVKHNENGNGSLHHDQEKDISVFKKKKIHHQAPTPDQHLSMESDHHSVNLEDEIDPPDLLSPTSPEGKPSFREDQHDKGNVPIEQGEGHENHQITEKQGHANKPRCANCTIC